MAMSIIDEVMRTAYFEQDIEWSAKI